MPTCRPLLAATLLLALMAAPCGAVHEGVFDFILKRGGTAEQARNPARGGQDGRHCFQTASHLVCYRSRQYNAAGTSPQTRLALLRGLEIRARHDLYGRLVQAATTERYQNGSAVRDAYLGRVDANDGAYTLSGVEFLTFAEGDLLEAVAAAPYAGSLAGVEAACARPDFTERYGDTLLPRAKALHEQGRHAEALVILKELHDLKWARAEAYILACRAFIANGEPEEAGKLADEVMADLDPQLTADLAEDLGDIYMELKREPEAERAYRLAASRL